MTRTRIANLGLVMLATLAFLITDGLATHADAHVYGYRGVSGFGGYRSYGRTVTARPYYGASVYRRPAVSYYRPPVTYRPAVTYRPTTSLYYGRYSPAVYPTTRVYSYGVYSPRAIIAPTYVRPSYGYPRTTYPRTVAPPIVTPRPRVGVGISF